MAHGQQTGTGQHGAQLQVRGERAVRRVWDMNGIVGALKKTTEVIAVSVSSSPVQKGQKLKAMQHPKDLDRECLLVLFFSCLHDHILQQPLERF